MWVIKCDFGNRAYIEKSEILDNKVFDTRQEAKEYLCESRLVYDFKFEAKKNPNKLIGLDKKTGYSVVWVDLVELSF